MAKNEIWLIAYISRDFIKLVDEEITRYEYDNIEVYIPTIKLLKKKSKGKNTFEELPLLFNYGFFKMDYESATNKDFLLEMRSRISCIYGWVKDPSKALKTKPILNVDNHDKKAIPAAAMATDEEVSRMVRACNEMSIYGEDDMARVKEDDHITLEGYPFDGIEAKIISIDHKKKRVKVELQLETFFREVNVSFENVFYTVYKGFENKSRERSIEDMGDSNMMDHLIYKNTYHGK